MQSMDQSIQFEIETSATGCPDAICTEQWRSAEKEEQRDLRIVEGQTGGF